MSTKTLLFSIAVGLAVGAGGHALLRPQPAPVQSAQTAIATPSPAAPVIKDWSRVPLTELITSQIATGVSECPVADKVTLEACLAFQSSLAIWQRVDFLHECPILPESRLPESRSNSRSAVAPAKLTPDAAHRALRSPCFGYLYAISIANTVPVLVNTANRVFHMEVSRDANKSGSNPELCLIARHGICGNHAAVGVALFQRAGFEARAIEFYYTLAGDRLSHITAEVLIDGKWRLIDTTYGAYWIKGETNVPFQLMSTDELLAGKPAKALQNEALLPHSLYSQFANLDPFSYLSTKGDVIRGSIGEITISIDRSGGSESFLNKPNFIGDNRADNAFDGIKFKLASGGSGLHHISVQVLASAFSGADPASLCVDTSCETYSKEKTVYEFTARDPKSIYLRADMDVAYLVLKSVQWRALDQ